MWSFALLLLLRQGLAALVGWEDGRDLHHFVSRPDIRPPRYNVTRHQPNVITPGYWFVAPYTQLGSLLSSKRHEQVSYQTGAHIYDNDGELVWSGARLYDNTNVFGFRPTTINGQQRLSMVVDRQDGDYGTKYQRIVILDNHYKEIYRLEHRDIDFHEFVPAADGITAVVAWQWEGRADARSLNETERGVTGKGFREIVLQNGTMTEIWDPLQHGFDLSESWDLKGREEQKMQNWDWMHLNSVDKVHDGFVISARSTSSIWKVVNGKVKWRLGGNKSDFTGIGNKFAWQHDARVRFENKTHTLLSLLDNTEMETKQIYDGPSAAKFVMLNHRHKTATLERSISRPDGGVTYKLGNVQTLGDWRDDVIFVNWALDGYMTEHDANDQLVMEAKFVSPRMNTYRAFKMPFVGWPLDPPDLVVMPTAQGSAMYVSWNGATQVVAWAFYGDGRLLTTLQRTGFETMWMATHIGEAYAEGLSVDGVVLGTSKVVLVEGIQGLIDLQDDSHKLDFWRVLFYVSICGGVLMAVRRRGRRASLYGHVALAH